MLVYKVSFENFNGIPSSNLCFIREYMEECQEQMTELRKLKIDLSRERKRM